MVAMHNIERVLDKEPPKSLCTSRPVEALEDVRFEISHITNVWGLDPQNISKSWSAAGSIPSSRHE